MVSAMFSANLAPAIAPMVVIAIGNPSRGDDAIGPVLLARLEHWLAQAPEAAALQGQIELIEDFQLQLEHAIDIQERERILIIDAAVNQEEACRCYRAQAETNHSTTSHALSPEALLAVWAQINSEAPPPVDVLAVRGVDFALGADMSAAAQANLEEAWVVVQAWCLRTGLPR